MDFQVETLANLFSDTNELASHKKELQDVYNHLREDPTLSKQLFDKLIERHNAIPENYLGFVPGCCCCAVVDLSELEHDGIDTLELRALAEVNIRSDYESLVEHLADYRKTMHEDKFRRKSDGSDDLIEEAAIKMYTRFTTPTPISATEADYVYGVLRRNECIAKELYSFATAGAQYIPLIKTTQDVSDSPVVRTIRNLFRDRDSGGGGDHGGGGGGGGCCCCCCCCCGGGC